MRNVEHELRQRAVFEEVCAEELTMHFAVEQVELQAMLLQMRDGDRYKDNGTSYTGRSIAQMVNVGWTCWKSGSLLG